MLSVSDAQLSAKLDRFKEEMAQGVEEKSARLQQRMQQDGLCN